MNILLAGFSQYLELTGASQSTIRNYLSDVQTFMLWHQSKSGLSLSEETNDSHTALISSITRETIQEYFSSLKSQNTSPSLLLRTQASLRKLFTFCKDQQWIEKNPAQEVSLKTRLSDPLIDTKIHSDSIYELIFNEYEQALEKDGASISTIKNYTSDARQFLNWFLTSGK